MNRWIRFVGGGLLMLTLTLSAIVVPALAQEAGVAESGGEGDSRDSYLDALAEELGITREELDEAMKGVQLQMIDQWAESARERVEEGGSLLPNMGDFGEFPFGEGGVARSIGPIIVEGIRGGEIRGGIGGGTITSIGGALFEGSLTDLASFLGLSDEELLDELAAGKTLVTIAEGQGKTSDELRTYLIEQATERIDQQLQDSEDGSDDAGATPETSA